MGPSSPASSRQGWGRPLIVALLAAAWVASLICVVVTSPAGIPTSSDPGAAPIPIWTIVLPPLVGIALSMIIPRARSVPALPAHVDRKRPFIMTTAVLVALAVLFPTSLALFGIGDEGYILLKFAGLIVLPTIAVLVWREAIRIFTPKAAWRWWAPVLVVGIWAALEFLAPWDTPPDYGDVDPAFLLIAATLTAFTAGFGEEYFYRRLLQSRLEAVCGPWFGIAVTSLLFAAMHLPTHGTGPLWLDVARAIVAQGTFGVFMGVLWWRYRNLTLNVAAHVFLNGWAVGAYLLPTLLQ